MVLRCSNVANGTKWAAGMSAMTPLVEGVRKQAEVGQPS
jgi:hypothetical protein